MRSIWKGSLSLALLTVPVTVVKGTGGSDQEESEIRRLCTCCHKPFNRAPDTCPKGRHPETAAAAERGDDDLTPVVYGVETGKYKFKAIPDELLEEVEEAIEVRGLALTGTIDLDDLPLHLAEGFYYLRPDGKVSGADEQFALLHRALTMAEAAAVTYWQYRGNVSLVAIHPVGATLVMNLLPYRAEVREPDDACLDHADFELDERMVDMATQLVESMKTPFKYGGFTDARTERMAEAIKCVLKNKPLSVAEPVGKESAEDADDVIAQLEASLVAVAA